MRWKGMLKKKQEKEKERRKEGKERGKGNEAYGNVSQSVSTYVRKATDVNEPGLLSWPRS